MKISECRNCKSNKLILLFSLGKLAFTGKFTKKINTVKKADLELKLCKKCKLVQLGENFNLKNLYGPDYGYRTGINSTMTSHVKNVVAKISKLAGLKSGEAVLDIASNDGTLLNFYDSSTITFGIDPLVNKYKKYYKNINYKSSNFFDYNLVKKKIKQKFKIITALSVFYDLQDPNKFLKGIEKLLDEDGIALIEFADLASIIKFNMFDTICHEHLEYYSTKVLIKMLAKNNLKLINLKSNKINGSSKQYYITKKNSKFKQNARIIRKNILLENKLKLEKQSTYLDFIKKINILGINLKRKLNKIKKNGQSIHGYGASTKGNVLLQYYGLDTNFIDYIAERNSKKFNYYTPGTNIKITSESLSRKINPDFYLVLPWHFKNEIIVREKKTIQGGSSFIFPLPKINTIKKVNNRI